jgi:hypothetical protein
VRSTPRRSQLNAKYYVIRVRRAADDRFVLDRSGVDVCAKDPGFPVDITVRGDVVVFVRIYLGQTTWDGVMGKAVAIEGNVRLAQRIPEWIQLRKVPRPQPPSARPAA